MEYLGGDDRPQSGLMLVARTVDLDSRGGDVLAAIQIGRLIRKYVSITWIEFELKCYSSCALIFISDVWRTSFGELKPALSGQPRRGRRRSSSAKALFCDGHHIFKAKGRLVLRHR